jgi:hypothetical protein
VPTFELSAALTEWGKERGVAIKEHAARAAKDVPRVLERNLLGLEGSGVGVGNAQVGQILVEGLER